MIDRQMVTEQIDRLEAQKRESLQIVERCEGGLQICHNWLARIENEEAAAKAAADQARGEVNGVPDPA